jgi:hypothetical protein
MIPKRGKHWIDAALSILKYSIVAMIVSAAINPRKPHEFLLRKIPVTRAQRNTVLALRRTRMRALDGGGGVGTSAIVRESKTARTPVAT